MMIGLEYILQLVGMQQKDLAENLGINKQNITLWIKGKQNIPKKYLPILSDIFGLEQSYFQMELNEMDKLEIQNTLMLYKIQGSFAVELPDDDDQDEVIDGHPVIKITPKNYDTDPIFSKIYRNQLEIHLLQNLEDIKNIFTLIDEFHMEEVERNQLLKTFCNVINQLDSTLFNIMDGKDSDFPNLLIALSEYREMFKEEKYD